MAGSYLAVVPARGGSKTVPRKNLHPLGGHPLIAYTLASAAQAKSLDRVVVSTDDAEIAEVAMSCGVEVVWRPAELATDRSKTGEAVRHVLDELGRAGYRPDAVATLQPTSPLRSADLVDRVVAAFEASGYDSAMTVTPVSAKVGRVESDRFRALYPPDNPRQGLEPLYLENGNVYVTRAAVILERGTLFGADLLPVVLDEVEGLDVDTELNFALAEFWLSWFPGRFGGGLR